MSLIVISLKLNLVSINVEDTELIIFSIVDDADSL